MTTSTAFAIPGFFQNTRMSTSASSSDIEHSEIKKMKKKKG